MLKKCSTEKVKCFTAEENPVEIVGILARMCTERLGPWDGNRPWNSTKVLQSSLFSLLSLSDIMAGAVWIQNLFELKISIF